METINTLISSLARLFGGAASSTDFYLLTVMFGTILFMTYGGLLLLNPNRTIQKRISANNAIKHGDGDALTIRKKVTGSALNEILEKFEKHIVGTDSEKLTVIRTKLIQAGYMSISAVGNYYLARILLAIIFPTFFLISSLFYASEMSTTKLTLISMGLGVVGLYLPFVFIRNKLENRQLIITEGFPDALDMMVVCVEAGLGFDATLVRVSEQLTNSHPVLAILIGFISLEVRAGAPRSEALKHFAARTGIPDINTFVTLLIQSETLGVDLAQTLRVQAEELRSKRMNRAEEKAHKLPVKLTIPLIAFILPAMLAVVLAPAIISIIRNIIPAL